MQMDCDLGFGEPEIKLIKACVKNPPDFEEAERLIISGANVNAVEENGFGFDVLSAIFLWIPEDYPEDLDPKDCGYYDLQVAHFLIEHGFNTQKHGFHALHALLLSAGGEYIFDTAKLILKNGVYADNSKWEGLLEAVATEESFYSCAPNLWWANLDHAYYELLSANHKNKPFEGIELCKTCIDKRISSIYVHAERNQEWHLHDKNRDILFCEPLVICCEDKNVVIRWRPNIYVNQYIFAEMSQGIADVSEYFGSDIIGHLVTSVKLRYKIIKHETTHFIQPIIILILENGKRIRFTTNFGETAKKNVKIFFSVYG